MTTLSSIIVSDMGQTLLFVLWNCFHDRCDKLLKTQQSEGFDKSGKRVAPTLMPKNWKSFLSVNENKRKLFDFLCHETTQL